MKFLVFALSVVVILEGYKITCCKRKERAGLFEIKSYFLSINQDHSKLLPSWTYGNCCGWEGVTCSPSGHVIHLSLNSMVQPVQGWTLNMTIFHSFEELEGLDLSNNTIQSFIHTSGVGMLKNLEELDLRYSHQTGGLPDFLWNLTSLRILDFGESYLVGELDARVCELITIRELYLANNVLNGIFPDCVWNLTSLQVLDLSGNSFTGNLPSQITLPSLEYFSIQDNNFQGKFSLSSLTNHSSLSVLILSNNALQVHIEDSSTPLTTQVVDLSLSNCNLSVHTKTLHKFLSLQSSLEYVDLTNNNLVGSFPTWLLQNNPNLLLLYLGNNSMSGDLQLPLHSHLSLFWMQISRNQFGGEIPRHIGTALPALNILQMAGNSFQGLIPYSLGNMTQLEVLDLSNNNLHGKVPKNLYSYGPNLQMLLLSNNSLDGEIIPSYMNLPSLMILRLDNNHFKGGIKESLKISTDLQTLDLSNNEATGGIPTWIGRLSDLLTHLIMAGNQINGSIPIQICKLQGLDYLDLSNNKLTGEMPFCGCPSNLRSLYLHGNNLTGSIPRGLQSCSSSLKVLHLGSNRLSGVVPRWINLLQNLMILILRDNRLQEELPNQLCQLKHLNIFDVSNNNISGVIPSCFRNLPFGRGNNSLDGFSILKLQYSMLIQLRKNAFSMVVGTYCDLTEEVDFIVKSRYAIYQGDSIKIMSILDMSSNILSGSIPPEIGDLKMLNTLNLSHNHLSGPIPKSFSKLVSTESLDLSWNNLSGTIPSELVDLNFLEIFNVSYNNLSGEVPKTGQFANYDEDNYRGNPLLRGVLSKCCTVKEAPSSSPTEQGDEEDSDEFDFQVFFWSFGTSYIILLLTFFAVLYINPAWRRAWSAFLDYHLLWWL